MASIAAQTKKQPVTSRKAREFARREQEILDVALECFSGDDWESVTVAQIAEIVGIAKGTMYLHFASKQEIYARLTLDFYRDLLSHLTRSRTDSGVERLSDIIRQAFRFYLQHPKYRCVTQYCEREDFRLNLNPEIAAKFDAIDNDVYQLLYRELALGIDEGVFKPLAIDQQILGLKCTFHGALTVLWCNRHDEQSEPEQFISTVTGYMLAPIVAQPAITDTSAESNHFPTPHKMPVEQRALETTHNE